MYVSVWSKLYSKSTYLKQKKNKNKSLSLSLILSLSLPHSYSRYILTIILALSNKWHDVWYFVVYFWYCNFAFSVRKVFGHLIFILKMGTAFGNYKIRCKRHFIYDGKQMNIKQQQMIQLIHIRPKIAHIICYLQHSFSFVNCHAYIYIHI